MDGTQAQSATCPAIESGSDTPLTGAELTIGSTVRHTSANFCTECNI